VLRRCRSQSDVQLPGSTRDREVGRERATGIEPAFSAWEADRSILRDLPRCGRVQREKIRDYPLVFAVVPILSSHVAGNCGKSAGGTLWHGKVG
jgi:hypothetical protein